MSPIAARWLKFNFVGAVGIGVQMGTFAALKGGLGMDYMPATALAVEMAVLHNFVWHERFTWKGRVESGVGAATLRLVKFHAGNGVVSILGNLALVRLMVGAAHWNPYAANLASIAACALVNFAVSEWFVFRR